MKYWLARVLIFLAISLVWLSRCLNVFKHEHSEVLRGAADLKQLQDVLKMHTNQFIEDFFLSIKARMPWNK